MISFPFLPCFSRSQWFILSVFIFVSASSATKNEFICSISSSAVQESKGMKRKELSPCLTYLWFKDIFTRFSFVCFLMYSTLKNYSVLAPFLYFFDFENLFHMFSQIFRFISLPFRSHTESKCGRWVSERVRDTEKRKKVLSYKSFFSYFLIYFHCKI
jgi:hypothetical protein